MAPAKHVHILISTGQNISNLIPLLQYGQKRDKVIILESTGSRNAGWGGRFSRLLDSKGYEDTRIIQHADEELFNVDRLRRLWAERLPRARGRDVFVYLNGGQKLSAIALVQSLAPLSPRMIYMRHMPVGLLCSGQEGGYHFEPIRVEVALRDLLQLYGARIRNADTARCIYRNNRFNEKNPPGHHARFWRDGEFIRLMLGIYMPREKNENGSGEKIPFDLLKRVIEDIRDMPAAVRHLSSSASGGSRTIGGAGTIANFIKRVENAARRKMAREKPVENIDLTPETASALKQAGIIDSGHKGGMLRQGDLRKKMGQYFEEVVADRFRLFLKDNPAFQTIISEIWLGTEFCSLDDTATVTGEYDILLLLKNGLLVSLECKTGDFETKDIFARVARLTRRGGGLAMQWVVAPLFTSPELEQGTMHGFHEKITALGMPFIPFNLEGQPDSYIHGRTGERVPVMPFEESLRCLLKPYLPATDNKSG